MANLSGQKKVTRRDLFRYAGFVAGGIAATSLLQACGGAAAAPTATPAPKADQQTGPEPTKATSTGGSVKGNIVVWQSTRDTPKDQEQWDKFIKYMKDKYPDINVKTEAIDYGNLMDKTRVAAKGGNPPDVAWLVNTWGQELAASGYLMETPLEEYGYTKDTFFPYILKSAQWNGKFYGIPVNNECMGFIRNKALFEKAGLDPNKSPETWADVVTYSKQIKDKLGISGFGLVARINNGNTPYRFMPILWAYGGAALDETELEATYKEVRINSDKSQAALQTYYDMYVRDKSVPSAALTNTQTECRELFINEQIAMMISHPLEYPMIIQKKASLESAIDYALYPSGPVARKAVYGGWNIHIFKKVKDVDAAKTFVKEITSPEWSAQIAWWSNPANRKGFETEINKQRQKEIRFLDVTTKMLEYGQMFPMVPESAQILNFIVPTMIHNALTEKMTVKAACDNAADEIKKLMKL